MKASLVTWSVVVALTLAICLFFYYASSEPLSGPGITLACRFLRRRCLRCKVAWADPDQREEAKMRYTSLLIPCKLVPAMFSVILLLSSPALGAADKRSEETEPGPVLTCTPDQASVFPGETTTIKVLVNPGVKEPLTYRWSATAGQIEGRGPEAKWSFAGVRPGLYEATVRVRDQKGKEREYPVRVAVNERPGERGRRTGWHLLVKGKQEEQGYGLYSYVLFGSIPEGEGLKRFVETIKAYLSLMPAIVGLEEYSPRKELNISYLPVREENPEAADDPKEKLTPEWVFKNYDLARASTILAKLEGNYRDGPYILAFLSPPLKSTTTPRPYLTMDLSKVPPNLIRAWMKEFLNQAAQERYWEERRVPKFVLNLRTGIEVASNVYPDVEKAVKKWVTLTQ